MSKVLSTRIDSGMASRLEKASKKLHLDKTSFVKIVIARGLKEIEQGGALSIYKRGEISIGKLSELLNTSYWDTLDILSSNGVTLEYSKEDFKEDIESL